MGNCLTQRVLSTDVVTIDILRLLNFCEQTAIAKVYPSLYTILVSYVWTHDLTVDAFQIEYDADLHFMLANTGTQLNKLNIIGAGERLYWKSLEKAENMCRDAGQFKHITDIFLSDVHLDTQDVHYIVTHFQKLERLEFDQISYTKQEDANVNFDIVLSSLKTLKLKYSHCLRDFIEKCCPNLKELSLCLVLKPDLTSLQHTLLPMEEISTQLKNFSHDSLKFEIFCKKDQPLIINLYDLHIASNAEPLLYFESVKNIKNLSILELKEAFNLSDMLQLKSLTLGECRLRYLPIPHTFINLKYLHIYSITLIKKNFCAILKNLKQLHTLTLLRAGALTNTESITEPLLMESSSLICLRTSWEGLQNFFEQQPNAFKNLKILYLEHMYSVNKLIKLFIENCKLKKLDLIFCHIDMDEPCLISLSQWASLAELSIRDGKHGEGFNPQYLLQSDSLKNLNIEYCSPTSCRVERFKIINSIPVPNYIKFVISINDTCFIDNIKFWQHIFKKCNKLKLFIYGDIYYILQELSANPRTLRRVKSIQFSGEINNENKQMLEALPVLVKQKDFWSAIYSMKQNSEVLSRCSIIQIKI